jgi:hypothetical protein
VTTKVTSKFVGTPFGMFLNSIDANEFLMEKVEKKFRYWFTTKLSLAKREVVVISILLSSI